MTLRMPVQRAVDLATTASRIRQHQLLLTLRMGTALGTSRLSLRHSMPQGRVKVVARELINFTGNHVLLER